MSRTLHFKGIPVTFDDDGFAGPWLYGESDVKTCACLDRSNIIVKPSGLAICADCGMPLPVQPPPPKERP